MQIYWRWSRCSRACSIEVNSLKRIHETLFGKSKTRNQKWGAVKRAWGNWAENQKDVPTRTEERAQLKFKVTHFQQFSFQNHYELKVIPWSAKTKAPASNAKSFPDSLERVTVRPELVVVFPVTKTPLGETLAQLVNIWDFPRPGSPTTKILRDRKCSKKI